MERFSKKAMRGWIEQRIARMEREYGFTNQNGWKQVEGRGEEINRAYGQYDELHTLLDSGRLD